MTTYKIFAPKRSDKPSFEELAYRESRMHAYLYWLRVRNPQRKITFSHPDTTVQADTQTFVEMTDREVEILKLAGFRAYACGLYAA